MEGSVVETALQVYDILCTFDQEASCLDFSLGTHSTDFPDGKLGRVCMDGTMEFWNSFVFSKSIFAVN